jgi:5-methylcytosine-specific restriction endonuclease McrA
MESSQELTLKEKRKQRRLYTSREWKKRNKEKVLNDRRDYYAKNKLRERALQKKYAIKNSEMFRFKTQKRRALILERLHPDHNDEIEKVLLQQCKHLELVLGIKFELDHIIPLSKNGWHHHLNLHIIPMRLNRRKKDKDISVIPDCWNPKNK